MGLDQLDERTVVMYARNGQGEISTFSLPESGASGNWGKSAAHRSGSLKEKTAKAATGGTGLVTDVAIAVSSKKRETPRDNQELADSSHSTMCPKPRKCIKMDQEADFVPETPPSQDLPVLQRVAQIIQRWIASPRN